MSSDEDDTLAVTFDPLVVSRSSPVGVIMQKWLTASRRRLGGVFPRKGAAEEMAAYTRRMKKKVRRRRATAVAPASLCVCLCVHASCVCEEGGW